MNRFKWKVGQRMIEIVKTENYLHCDACGVTQKEDGNIHSIKTSFGSCKMIMQLSFCNKCMKELRSKIDYIGKLAEAPTQSC